MKQLVIKIGGEIALDSPQLSLVLRQCAAVVRDGVKLVIVHGGGPQATELAERLGVESRFVAGRRVTSPEMLEVAAMTFGGAIASRIAASAHALELPLVAISGISGGLIQATKRPPVDGVDYGMVGDITKINTEVLTPLLQNGFAVLVSPLGIDPQGQRLNINADTVAAAIATAIGADQFLLVSNVPGVLRDPNDPGSKIDQLDPFQAQQLIESGVISGGMIPKVTTCLAALAAGVPSARIVGGREPDSIVKALASNEGGTSFKP